MGTSTFVLCVAAVRYSSLNCTPPGTKYAQTNFAQTQVTVPQSLHVGLEAPCMTEQHELAIKRRFLIGRVCG